MSFVYLLGNFEQENVYKIGITRGKIENRIKQLQTGSSGGIYLVNYHKTKYPFFIEKNFHMKYYPNHVIGEWFELSPEEVLNFKEDCQFFENNAKILEENAFAKNILK